ncbi:MAG TPA: tetratricopeptide repeat protein [Vicinamibacterales bacterium]|nr:tetratricopeptide repeat protein [Vicinamibacterales bacterium]
MADLSRIDELRRRVQKDPTSIAFAQLGEELRRAGELKEAVAVCRAGLARHANYASARVTLGRALMELNDLDNAEAELRVALKSAPDNLSAIRARADIFHRRGDLEAALAHYRVALGLARNDPDLQRLVDDLSRTLGVDLMAAPPKAAAPAKPTAANAMPAKSTPAPAAAPGPPKPDPGRQRAVQTIAALERFLAAVHVVRTQQRA